MYRIGIIGAMEEEVTLLRNKIKEKELYQIAGMDFYKGIIDNNEMVVVRCGIGKVNAAVCTQALLIIFKVDYIINTGVAGAISVNLK